MFDWLSNSSDDAISILKHDHDTVKKLFEQFEKTESRAAKKKIVAEALLELKVHAAIEEEIFYPAVRKRIGKDIMTEADEEHHVAKVLIAELEAMTGREDHYDAKFTVLAENVTHHIKEEEDEMLPKARKTAVDFEELGRQLLRRKEALKSNGVPPVAEEAMVAAGGQSADSPAKAAKTRKTRAPRKKTAA